MAIIVHELNDVIQNRTHYIGWMHVHSKDQMIRAILRDKRERLQLKRPINPMVPSDQFKEALEQQQIAIHERTQRVIEQKKKQMENIPEWYKDDSDVDMHETISNNCNNHCDNRNGNRRRSKRNVKPSDAMIQSQKYQHRINGIFDS
eukprot:893208_1